MTEIYTGSEYKAELTKKKRMFTTWIIILVIYVIICVAVTISFALLPYGTKQTLFIGTNIALSTIFWGATMFMYANKYYRLKKYVRMLGFLHTGIMETYSGWFLRFNEGVEVKDGVEFYYAVFLEWNAAKQEHFERKVLIDREIEKPAFEEKRLTRFTTQGNILVKYMLLNSVISEESIVR